MALRPLEDAAAEITTPAIAELDKQVAEWKQVSATDPAKRPAEIKQQIAEAAAAAQSDGAGGHCPPQRSAESNSCTRRSPLLDERDQGAAEAAMVYAAANYFEPHGTFRFAAEPRPVTVC